MIGRRFGHLEIVERYSRGPPNQTRERDMGYQKIAFGHWSADNEEIREAVTSTNWCEALDSMSDTDYAAYLAARAALQGAIYEYDQTLDRHHDRNGSWLAGDTTARAAECAAALAAVLTAALAAKELADAALA